MKNVKRKRSIIGTIFNQSPELVVTLGIITAVFLPYLIGLIVRNFVDESAREGIPGLWFEGFLAIFALAFLAFIGFIIISFALYLINLVRRIKTCMRYTYMPLTDEEIKEQDIKTAGEYLKLFFDSVSYKDAFDRDSYEYLDISQDDLYTVHRQLFSIFYDSLLDLLNNYKEMPIKVHMENEVLESVSEIINVREGGFIEELLLPNSGIHAEDSKNNIMMIVYANYKFDEKTQRYCVNVVYDEVDLEHDFYKESYYYDYEDHAAKLLKTLREAVTDNRKVKMTKLDGRLFLDLVASGTTNQL